MVQAPATMTAAVPPAAVKRKAEGTTCAEVIDGGQPCGGQLELVASRIAETVVPDAFAASGGLTTRVDSVIELRCRQCGAAEIRVRKGGQVSAENDIRSW